ncbi:MAG: hypothetical protein APG12_01525 [Candidatus Methanofastidiosum methylothiophilum]|uniref:Uncharacterized protein n=1 Tax=Candidatus Methanofastidiosum methylothiophilum TaxID=1705564 RepID=A0A150IWJ9_9EURY|nr:MAG: hypothetical protein APG10_01361 [Candidatus Methanofastidiosum methylthiophilus]KYC47004.1 MAG: hypothetical protein APG11_01503 [Candidatus Methanofastidiosum methylthiophilus]KYC49379.1 MAG: hypothetical protein APG12_01525 [Candidatus Methanofastidiosum methylthiophilus]
MSERPTITMAERNKIIMDLRKQFTEKFIVELKQQHPDWSDTKIRGVAENMAQKEVSKNTEWNVDVVEKGKVVYKAGRGEETMVQREPEQKVEQKAPQASQTATKTPLPKKGIKDILSEAFKKKK